MNEKEEGKAAKPMLSSEGCQPCTFGKVGLAILSIPETCDRADRSMSIFRKGMENVSEKENNSVKI